MTETATIDKMYHEIIAIRREIEFIKDNMVKEDMFLTLEEEEKLEETLEAHKKGKTILLEDFKRKMGD